MLTIEQKIKDLENIYKSYDVVRESCAEWKKGCCGQKGFECVNHFKNGCVGDREGVKQLIEWLTDYRNRLRKEEEFRPKELYAIEYVPSGKIIFNARGGCYKHLDEVEARLAKLGEENYRIVTYKLQEGDSDGWVHVDGMH